MRWSQMLTPLDSVTCLDGRLSSTLREHHITTAEDLVGQIEADPAAMAHLLEITADDLESVARCAYAAIPASRVVAMKEQRSRSYPLGALPPRRRAGQ